jgi:hypothetical protein
VSALPPATGAPAQVLAAKVTLSVTPPGAKVVQVGSPANLNDRQGSSGMVELTVNPSSPAALEVSAPGYVTTQVRADGKAPFLRVDLVPAQGRKQPASSKSAGPKKKCNPGEDLCDPFG